MDESLKPYAISQRSRIEGTLLSEPVVKRILPKSQFLLDLEARQNWEALKIAAQEQEQATLERLYPNDNWGDSAFEPWEFNNVVTMVRK